MNVTYYGHSSFLMELGGKKLLFDPFITGNEAAAEVIDINTIVADYILLSHGHQDHILDAPTIAANTQAVVIANYEVGSWMSKQANVNPNVMTMNHGGKAQTDFGTVKYVNAIHSSSFADGSYAGNPGGFVILNGEKNIYYAGDTALTYDMKLIGEQYDIDLAFLPVGDFFTMGYEDALKAAEFVNCNTIVGMHFDTFPPIKIDHDAAEKAFTDAGKELILPELNNTYDW